MKNMRYRSLGLIGFVCIFGLLAQDPPASESAAAKEAAKPPAVAAEDAKPTEAPKPAEAAPTPQQPVVTAPEPAASKSKGSSKRSNGGRKNQTGGGSPTFTSVDARPYVIGPEDILFLNVLHQADVTGTLPVRPDGFISVRFAGEVKAAGLTTQQLSDEVADKLTKYFNHPEVNIQVIKIVSKKYYIAGEIRKPGAYVLSSPKTILEAIIEAGGPAEFAKSSKIYVLRGKDRIPFNYKDVSKGKNLQQNILVENGDVIQVP